MLKTWSATALCRKSLDEIASIESLHAPTGGAVELPCDVTPALPGDSMGLLIWYKQGHDTPIYSLDTREGVTSHWSDPSTLGSRASFRSDSSPAVLVITKLRPEDSGQYRCRVDFIKSPTKNTRLNLTILIPPERLIILNHEGHEIQGGIVGPYDEGTELPSSICKLKDANLPAIIATFNASSRISAGGVVGVNRCCGFGRPTARVSWWKSHALLANSEARATVSFRLQRSDYGTDVTCQAVTDPSIPPVSETLTIDVNLRPLWVRLQGGKRPLVAGQSTELVCQAVGARPKPVISWWKHGVKLNTNRETVSRTWRGHYRAHSKVPVISWWKHGVKLNTNRETVSRTWRGHYRARSKVPYIYAHERLGGKLGMETPYEELPLCHGLCPLGLILLQKPVAVRSFTRTSPDAHVK
ncbi:immunoglobulin v-set domain-containing protein [Phthorimaea operculella]|nr:immunoglobulin v-set domain-containing protein [Phthorimaea operculella]